MERFFNSSDKNNRKVFNDSNNVLPLSSNLEFFYIGVCYRSNQYRQDDVQQLYFKSNNC